MIRVLVADDQPLMRTALEHFVSQAPDLEAVGGAQDGLQALEMARAARPDVVLMDMQMPRMDGIEATRRITAAHPSTRVLAVTTFTSQDYVVPALRAGAAGYLVKDADPETVVGAIHAVRRGDAVLSPAVAARLVSAVERDRPAVDRVEPRPGDPDGSDLTDRERAVLELLARGLSNGEIAVALTVTESTVKGHVMKIIDKLEVRDRIQAVIRAAQLGLVTLSLG